MKPIIDVEELFEIYLLPGVKIIDVTNHAEAAQWHAKEHLEGAIFLDLNSELSSAKADFSEGGRHPLPNISSFSKTLGNHGIQPNDHLIVYDHYQGANAAARFWWMMKSVGHKKVQVLNGGFSWAKKNHFPTFSGNEIPPVVADYPCSSWNLPQISISEIENHLSDSILTIVDVRNKDRFEGKFEPIDLWAGHIPGAINFPFSENLDSEGLFLKPELLKEKYLDLLKSSEPDKTVFHCGSGVTACHSILAMVYAGLPFPRLYVGSWSEWSRKFPPQ